MSGAPVTGAPERRDLREHRVMQLPRGLALAVLCSCGGAPGNPSDAGRPTEGGATEDATAGFDAAPAGRQIAYVSGYGPGIGRFDIAGDGQLTAAGTTPAFAPGPSFLAITGTTLYAVSETNSRVAAYAIDPASGALSLLDDAGSGGAGPAHVSVDRSGAFVLVANYGDGQVATLAIRGDGGVAAPRSYAVGKNAHMIVTDPSNHYAFVPCLGSDYVAQFTFDATTGELAPNSVPHLATAPGAGPRHLAFAPDGRHAYLINELASTLSALAFDATTGRLSTLQTTSTRAAGATGNNTGAEIAVHPSGRFVYASNRGDNTIAVFGVTGDGMVSRTGEVATGGRTPRHFAIDPGGTRLYAADQDDDTVVEFTLDLQTGMLTPAGVPVSAAQPAFIGITTLPRR